MAATPNIAIWNLLTACYTVSLLNARAEAGPAKDVRYGTERQSGPCLQHAGSALCYTSLAAT